MHDVALFVGWMALYALTSLPFAILLTKWLKHRERVSTLKPRYLAWCPHCDQEMLSSSHTNISPLGNNETLVQCWYCGLGSVWNMAGEQPTLIRYPKY